MSRDRSALSTVPWVTMDYRAALIQALPPRRRTEIGCGRGCDGADEANVAGQVAARVLELRDARHDEAVGQNAGIEDERGRFG